MIPGITGTVGGQTVTLGNTINPFANATAIDGNSEGPIGAYNGANFVSPIATITLLNNGNQTGADGTLTLPTNDDGTTLHNNGNGQYVLSVNDPSVYTQTNDNTLTQGLHDLKFIPSTDATTTFSVYMTDKDNEHTTNTTTTVKASGSGSPPSTPSASSDWTITGEIYPNSVEKIANDSIMTVNDQQRFYGQSWLVNGVIDLNGLANADSYTFKNDILSIYSGNKLLESMNFTSNSSAFSVENIGNGVVSIYTADDTRHQSGTLIHQTG
ncbi:unnamed protein product [Sphagnum tenellum]